jgi:cation:H+ antiporter
MIVTYIISILALFFVLSMSADIVIFRIRQIADKFKIGVGSLGMLLGAFTTLPELFVGFNSVTRGIPELYFGNLMGGIIVIFCLILGFSLLLNRRVDTDGKYSSILPISFVLLLPISMGFFNQGLNVYDGIIFLIIYLIFLYKNSIEKIYSNRHDMQQDGEVKLSKSIFWIFFGVTLLLVSSHYIVEMIVKILESYNVPALLVGTLVFSVGTNLPDIVVAFRSWAKHAPELSLNHLIGAALSYLMVLGLMLVLSPLSLTIDASYKFLFLMLVVTMYFVSTFYKSGAVLTRREGYKLLGVYLMFILGQIYFA